MAFLPLINSDHVVALFFVDFSSETQWDAPFHCIAYDYSCDYWDGVRDHLRDVAWNDIFKISAFTGASEFCEWIYIEIDVHVHHRKYQAKSWFSTACAAAILHKKYIFCLF